MAWYDDRDLDLFHARRADIEEFARELERRGRARATVARRICTVTSFYRYAEEEGLLAHSPAVHVRRPRIDYESHATGLDRNEVGALLVAAGLGVPCEHALVSLLALNGLRVSEATGADIDRLGLERGHRTLTILRKGGKIVTTPLAPRRARAIDLAIGERLDGPIFVGLDGKRLDRHAAGRIVRRVARGLGSTRRSGRIPFGMRSSPQPSTPESRCATSKRLRRTPIRVPPCATTGRGSHSTDTPPTSSRPSSLAQLADCLPAFGHPSTWVSDRRSRRSGTDVALDGTGYRRCRATVPACTARRGIGGTSSPSVSVVRTPTSPPASLTRG